MIKIIGYIVLFLSPMIIYIIYSGSQESDKKTKIVGWILMAVIIRLLIKIILR